MATQYTTYTERVEMVKRKLDGETLQEIAAAMGWSFECVRKWWRRFRDGGYEALRSAPRHAPGPMAHSHLRVRYVALRLKCEHPKWGPEVIRARMAERPALKGMSLPSPTTLWRYFRALDPHGARGLMTRYGRTLPQSTPQRATRPHEVWQMDFKEDIRLPGIGPVVVTDIRETYAGVAIATVPQGPTDAGHKQKPSQATLREILRDEFERWGLPQAIQTDRDKVVVGQGKTNTPFPSDLTLWWIGLGIWHRIIPKGQPQRNGCVERGHRTWAERVVVGQEVALGNGGVTALQRCSDQELTWMNERLPSRGGICDGQPPLETCPQAHHSGRSYHRSEEEAIFSLARVYRYLAEGKWVRQVSVVGQVSLGGHRYGLGGQHRGQEVEIRFDPAGGEFVFSSEGEEIARREAKGLSLDELLGRREAPLPAQQLALGLVDVGESITVGAGGTSH